MAKGGGSASGGAGRSNSGYAGIALDANRQTGNASAPLISYRAGGTITTVEAAGAKMLPDKVAGSKFFVHKSPDGNGWVVSEFSSGSRVVGGDTRASAISAFHSKIKELRVAYKRTGMGFNFEWKDMINRAIGHRGMVNRG